MTVTDEHLRAGCQIYTFQEWRTKTEREVLAMDGKGALVFYKETLIPLMDALKLGV
uniref:Pentapeptide repeat-containing protein n=1 Tax=Aeromonas phage PS TaxID=2723762 RepID=A0A6H0X6K2_9CAUD|nr:pentapeptide repeat-containing protein [Aeromonas phage PS]